jgi:iron(II)-dependent oxidoreductase
VPRFLAGAAVTIIGSTSPETFCNTAAEALAVATPVVGYRHGHIPSLVGPAGVTVPLTAGPAALWTASRRLLADPVAYHRASAAGPARVQPHSPVNAAQAFLTAAERPAGGPR